MANHGPSDFSPGACTRLLAGGRHGELAQILLGQLDRVAQSSVYRRTDAAVHFADVFVQTLTYCFCQPDFQFDRQAELRFVAHNATLANLAAISRYGTTDIALGILANEKSLLAKILALYSPLSSFDFNARVFFDADPVLASHWWFAFLETRYLASARVLARLRAHFAHIDERLTLTGTKFNLPYFLVTYAAPKSEKDVKERINRLIREHWPAPPGKPGPSSPKRILVVSAFWNRSHSVWRTVHKYVAGLAGKYELVLAALEPPHPKDDTGVFDRVVRVDPRCGNDDIRTLRDLGARVAIFPDIGMSPASIVLANQRLAPIQIMAQGHPVSTFGGEIDYYLGGRDIEDAKTARNYSERLALISGRGVDPTVPGGPFAPVAKSEDPLVVSCPWAVVKTNAEIVALLGRIAEGVRRPVHFHFMPGAGLTRCGHVPFEDILRQSLAGSTVTVHPNLGVEKYLAAINGSHLALDSFPFGGLNTVVDALGLGVPFVAYEGTRAFNRFGAHFLRRAGLAELVAGDDEGYVAKAVAILADRDYRRALERKIRAVNRREELYADGAADFPKLIDYLIANHERLARDKSRKPIWVGK